MPPSRIQFTRFDSTAIQSAFPGITTFQLDNGPTEGWIQSITLGPITIHAGSLNRAALYEGHFNRGKINISFMLDPTATSTAMIYGHEYDSGVLSIAVGAIPIHEAYPPNLIWAAIDCPESFLRNELNAYPRLLETGKLIALSGSREQLLPLVHLVQHTLNRHSPMQAARAKPLAIRIQKMIHSLLTIRLKAASHELPYAQGDKYLTRLLHVSLQLAKEAHDRPVSLTEISKVTGMKNRTLQKYFHNLYGVGPTEFFRIRRLNQVRAALLQEDSSTATIQKVAHQWGFTHMGRLSLQYKRLFGESPSKTLNRRSNPGLD